MKIIIVHIHVKPEFIESFKIATLENARNSIREPGVARFDVFQQSDDPTYFELIFSSSGWSGRTAPMVFVYKVLYP